MNPRLTAQLERLGPWLLGLAALLPFIWCRASFADLFVFGDEWDQLDQLDYHGFWRWMVSHFAENYTPVSKTVWAAALYVSGGSFFLFVFHTWVIHALTTAAMAATLRKVGLGWTGTLFACLVFSLAWTNVETLAWTVQVVFILSLLSFFLACRVWLAGALTPRSMALLCGLLLAGALSSSRGVVSGGAIAAAVFFGMIRMRGVPTVTFKDGARHLVFCLIPVIVGAAAIIITSSGNHAQFTDGSFPVAQAWEFGASTYFLNPLHQLLGFQSLGWRTTVLLGGIKLAILAGGLWFATPVQRRLLIALVALDLGSSILLGIGRYHTGIPASVSSRYQYYPLACMMPFVAVMIERGLGMLRDHQWTRQVAGAAIVVSVSWFVVNPWPGMMHHWSGYRGREIRHILIEAKAPPEEGAVAGIPSMRTSRAKELIKRFNLH